jgi:hypothetical protein
MDGKQATLTNLWIATNNHNMYMHYGRLQKSSANMWQAGSLSRYIAIL